LSFDAQTNFVSVSVNYTAVEVLNLKNIKVQVSDSTDRQGIIPLIFAKSAECLAVESESSDDRSQVQQIQFSFLVNKNRFQNNFNQTEANKVKLKFQVLTQIVHKLCNIMYRFDRNSIQETMHRVFNGMNVLKSIEFSGLLDL